MADVGLSDQYIGAPSQCTEWASQRYHQLTGIWVPWQMNGGYWDDGARAAGWVVSGTPTVGCIMNLKPGSQGAGIPSEPGVGHVNIVEQILDSNTIMTSNRNWPVGSMGPTYLKFSIHAIGTDFVWYPGKAGPGTPTGNAAAASPGNPSGAPAVPAGFQAAAALVPVLLIGIAVLAIGMAGIWLYSQVK